MNTPMTFDRRLILLMKEALESLLAREDYPIQKTITERLESIEPGESRVFPADQSPSSLRTLASSIGIKISVERLDSGELRVLRRK